MGGDKAGLGHGFASIGAFHLSAHIPPQIHFVGEIQWQAEVVDLKTATAAEDEFPAAHVSVEIERWQHGCAAGLAEGTRFAESCGSGLKTKVLRGGGSREIIERGVAEHLPPTGIFIHLGIAGAFPWNAVAGKRRGQVRLRFLMIGPHSDAADEKQAEREHGRENFHGGSMRRKCTRARARCAETRCARKKCSDLIFAIEISERLVFPVRPERRFGGIGRRARLKIEY